MKEDDEKNKISLLTLKFNFSLRVTSEKKNPPDYRWWARGLGDGLEGFCSELGRNVVLLVTTQFSEAV